MLYEAIHGITSLGLILSSSSRVQLCSTKQVSSRGGCVGHLLGGELGVRILPCGKEVFRLKLSLTEPEGVWTIVDWNIGRFGFVQDLPCWESLTLCLCLYLCYAVLGLM